ncbi:MAG: translation initiation factor IF-6 [Acidilobaceae archaeon]
MARFEIAKMTVDGNPNIGVYMHVAENYALVPPSLTEKEEELVRSTLRVDRVVRATLFNTRLIGVFAGGNSNGLILPRGVPEDEVKKIKRELGDINIVLVDVAENAIGNLLAANDRAAIIYPFFDNSLAKTISDALGVEVRRASIGGFNVVGSVLVVTNRGGVVCPEATEDEIKLLEEYFRVPIATATVNFGVSFVRAGLVANSKGALVGSETTGPEIVRIQAALGGGG